jgi:PPOX class probable FMN-dependent enzyme
MDSTTACAGVVSDLSTLREAYPTPSERAVRKTLPRIDHHMRKFISLSPFLCLGTSGDHGADVTPRGDAPGFVHVVDDNTLLIPDWPGNNRLDTLSNVIANPRVGILMFVPGMDETLRVNGEAEITAAPEIVARWDVNGKHPRSAIEVTVREAFFHCAKAVLRSKLWKDDYKIDRRAMPPYAEILKEETQTAQSVEEIAGQIAESYKNKLY